MKLSDMKLKQAAYSLVMAFFVIATLLIVNLIAETVDIQFDMTERGIFSLSEESKKIVSELENDVIIYGLYKQGREPKQVMGVLDKYDSLKGIRVEIIDPDRNPALLGGFQKNNETIETGSLIVQSGSFWQVISELDLYSINYSQAGPQILGYKIEQRITSAIAFVMTGRTPKVYEVTGHNELSLRGTPIEKELIAANFELASLNITGSTGIPEDCDILMLLGPQRDLTDYETGKMENFLKRGGRLFAVLSYTEASMKNLSSLLRTYDVEIYNGLAMERDTKRLLPEFGDNPFFFAPNMEDSPISDFIRTNQLDPFFSGAIGFGRTESEKRNITFNPLFTTSENSWLRQDMTKQDDALINTDIPGPINVAVTIHETDRDTGMANGARIVLLGSPTAYTDMGGMGILPGNIKTMIGSLNWLDNNIKAVSIPAKSIYKLPLKIDTKTALIYGTLVSIIIPLSIIIIALIVYRRRKNL